MTEKLSGADIKLANKCVRLYLMNLNDCLRHSVIINNILKPSSSKQAVLDLADETLKSVYGFERCIGREMSSDKIYFFRNLYPTILATEENSDNSKQLTFLILSVVYMSVAISKEKLNWFLNELGFSVENKHPLYGNVAKHIKGMVSGCHLIIDPDGNYKWGPRADYTVSKEEVLKFVSSIYDCQPESFHEQFAEAREQVVHYFTT